MSIILVVFHDTVQVRTTGAASITVTCVSTTDTCSDASGTCPMQVSRTDQIPMAICMYLLTMANTHTCMCGQGQIVELTGMPLIVQIEQALKIGGLEFVLKFLVYFAHERLWVQIGDNIN